MRSNIAELNYGSSHYVLSVCLLSNFQFACWKRYIVNNAEKAICVMFLSSKQCNINNVHLTSVSSLFFTIIVRWYAFHALRWLTFLVG